MRLAPGPVPWGCAAYVHFTSHKYGKLGPRARKCIFLQYPKGSKGYVFLGENEDGTRTEIESRNANFLEKGFPGIGETSLDSEFFEVEDEPATTDQGLDPSLSGSGASAEAIVPPLDESQQPRRSQRLRDLHQSNVVEEDPIMLAAQYFEDIEPLSCKQALSLPTAKLWEKAMQEEMESMRVNQVWDLVDLPAGRKAIGNKWVLKIKRNSDGSIERYKARLVAKGYTQKEGIDYDETFSPVVRFASLRAILAFVAKQDLELVQMDVKTAFLHGELE